jgi:hypothetical protein
MSSENDLHNFLQPGRFITGCNYWASHAGTRMWSDWNAAIVAADLKQLSQAGLQVLRIFPLWPDFQPLTCLYTGQGQPMEFRLGEEPLSFDEAGQAGISITAMKRFTELADLAEKNGLKLIVGLVTGWMSGRLFTPPAFAHLNVLTDPTVIMWQVRFVRYFVRTFKQHPAILAWDLGNECNCMADVSRQQAWVWTSSITNAIRVEDKDHPIVSGMHSLAPDKTANWTMQDQGELTDLLTTHPYPIFTPHCDQDPINTLRSCLHATAESRYYADIGGKPCIGEEVGTLGPFLASDKIAADYVRTALFSLWAHDCHGLLWWCAYDQTHLDFAPYDWHAYERELGLVRANREVKPVALELGRFTEWIKNIPVDSLPSRRTDAVCILSEDQDSWGAAYSSFILAKQAGFDLEFQFCNQPLKPSGLYLLPSLSGGASFSRRFWLDLLERVRAGATLYLSHLDCMLVPFLEPAGLQVNTRQRRSTPVEFTLDGEDSGFTIQAPIRLSLESKGAAVLAREQDGNPLFTCTQCGLGQLYFLTVPLETALSNTPGIFYGKDSRPFWKVYQHIAQSILKTRRVACDAAEVGITEHVLAEDRLAVVMINYSPENLTPTITLAPDWKISDRWYGNLPAIPANDAVVFTLERK